MLRVYVHHDDARRATRHPDIRVRPSVPPSEYLAFVAGGVVEPVPAFGLRDARFLAARPTREHVVATAGQFHGRAFHAPVGHDAPRITSSANSHPTTWVNHAHP